MHYLVFENVQITFVIILLTYIGTSSSASLFGLDLTAAEKNVKTRYDRMLSCRGFLNFYSHNDHLYQSNFHTPMSSTPTTIHLMDNFKLKPDLQLDKLVHDSQNGGMDTLVKMNSLGSFNSEDEFGNTNPIYETNQKTDTSELVPDDSSVTLGWSDIGTDYTTETSDYETITEEVLDRIGGPAPAVVATLLG